MEEKELAAQAEQDLLFSLVAREDILEKKVKIYSRLLTDPALAKTMGELSLRHEKRKEGLMGLALGKPSKKKNGQGMDATNEGGDEK